MSIISSALGNKTSFKSSLGSLYDTLTNANDMITSYSFSLLLEGVSIVPVQAVRAFRKEAEYDTVQEGGLNDYVHLIRKGATKPNTFQVERYADTSLVLETLAVGYEATLPLILMVYDGRKITSNIPLRTYAFTGAVVLSKDYGELNSERSALLKETVTIAYRELICINSDADKYSSLGSSIKGLFS